MSNAMVNLVPHRKEDSMEAEKSEMLHERVLLTISMIGEGQLKVQGEIMKDKELYEYHKHKYEITAHPALKKYYRLRMEGHNPMCAINMIETFDACSCGIDKENVI